jgi:hypothetical protein
MKPVPFTVLTDSSYWLPNTTVETILKQLFVYKWNQKVSFDLYYDGCAPQSCHYTYTMQYNRAYILATLLALFGGLTKGLRFVVLCIATIVFNLSDRLNKNKKVAPDMRASTIVIIREDSSAVATTTISTVVQITS